MIQPVLEVAREEVRYLITRNTLIRPVSFVWDVADTHNMMFVSDRPVSSTDKGRMASIGVRVVDEKRMLDGSYNVFAIVGEHYCRV